MNSEPDKIRPTHIKVADNISNPYKSDELPMPQIGDKIGPNKVEALIGEGSSACVYKVWHEGLEVVRAVKVLKQYTNTEARERFLTEAKILADIHHPNIVEIHNIGYIDQRIPFIEMEYVEGQSIKTLLSRNQRLPVPIALTITCFLCQALNYAHTKDYTLYGKVYRGLIHRDIKPDNIFISKDGIVKLMDFGIARPSEVSLHTVGGKIMGTLVYLSPEQLSGSTLDHRSDIFSLGTVLYEMVSGKRAFPQKTLVDVVQKKTKGIYAPITQSGVALPETLPQIINKSMALDPAARYNTSAEFGEECFAVFRSISNLSPNDIILRYLIDPTSIEVPVKCKTTSMPIPPWIMAAGAVLTLLALLVIAILVRLW